MSSGSRISRSAQHQNLRHPHSAGFKPTHHHGDDISNYCEAEGYGCMRENFRWSSVSVEITQCREARGSCRSYCMSDQGSPKQRQQVLVQQMQ
ncbi:hypothetical protein BDU57DRAFT_512762 [Ampelomyces quisqualis]|uniref:Uncharacterized protein n=1 Tax=Ampelomyces quisqualis TaxID=50730 RepID=A0A6A5QUW2_AMPQU|nr:hypothetical protein BDU57DRAFT_512762 [Ampelomyces quisqualis]